jgi:hypothetical protein
MRLGKLFLMATALAGVGASTTITVSSVDSGTGLQSSLWIQEDGTNLQLYFAGGIDVGVNGYSRLVYCVDMFTDINVPGTYTTVLDFANTTNLERVGWLMQNYWPSSIYTGSALQTQGAAFQLAIWDIMVDGGDGFTAGRVKKSSDTAHPTDAKVLAAAQAYETASMAKTAAYGIVYRNYLTSSPYTQVQTLMGLGVTDGGPSPVPEPGDFALIGGGLALLALGGSARHKKHS